MQKKQVTILSKKNKKLYLTIGLILFFVIIAGDVVYSVGANDISVPFFPKNFPYDKLSASKMQFLINMMQKREQAMSTQGTKPKGFKAILPTAEPINTPLGILNVRSGPFSSMSFTVRNGWQGFLGGKLLAVYAGGTPLDPATGNTTPVNGALRIYSSIKISPYTYKGTYVGLFPAPKGNGPLTITAVNGSVMQLKTDAGTTLTFDLQNNQYK